MPVHKTLCIFLLNETALQVYHSYLMPYFHCTSVATKRHGITTLQYGMILMWIVRMGMG